VLLGTAQVAVLDGPHAPRTRSEGRRVPSRHFDAHPRQPPTPAVAVLREPLDRARARPFDRSTLGGSSPVQRGRRGRRVAPRRRERRDAGERKKARITPPSNDVGGSSMRPGSAAGSPWQSAVGDRTRSTAGSLLLEAGQDLPPVSEASRRPRRSAPTKAPPRRKRRARGERRADGHPRSDGRATRRLRALASHRDRCRQSDPPGAVFFQLALAAPGSRLPLWPKPFERAAPKPSPAPGSRDRGAIVRDRAEWRRRQSSSPRMSAR
jgi:hypothetical protein